MKNKKLKIKNKWENKSKTNQKQKISLTQKQNTISHLLIKYQLLQNFNLYITKHQLKVQKFKIHKSNIKKPKIKTKHVIIISKKEKIKSKK